MLDSTRQDLVFAARTLRRSPIFAVAAVLTLGLGIGANTAVFSVVYSVLIKPLAYHQPERLVTIQEGGSPGMLHTIADQAESLESIAGFRQTSANVVGQNGPERLEGQRVVGPLFDVLGVPLAQGRGMTLQDNEMASPQAVVLSHQAARRLLNPNVEAIGQTVVIDTATATVIGVTAPGFRFPNEAATYWLAWRFDPPNDWQRRLSLVGRLAEGQRQDDARTELALLNPRFKELHAKVPDNVVLTSLLASQVGPVRGRLLLLAGCVGLVLLIACANVANLMLARVDHRRNELTVRRALGAGRGRLARQLVTESLVLSLLGGIAGLVLGSGLLGVLVRILPSDLPRLATIGMDLPVLLFTLGVTFLTSLIAGTLPAVLMSGNGAAGTLRDSRGSSRSPLRQALAISQIALAVTLLGGSGLLLRSFAQLLDVDPGMPVDQSLSFRVTVPIPPDALMEERLRTFQRVDQSLQEIPGLHSVTRTTYLPVNGKRGWGTYFNVQGNVPGRAEEPPVVMYRGVSQGYHEALGSRLLEGRFMSQADFAAQREVAVINESLARSVWPEGGAVGKVFLLGFEDEPFMKEATVVGVVADARDLALDHPAEPLVYVPDYKVPFFWTYIYVLRSDMAPEVLIPTVRETLQATVPGLPIHQIRTLQTIVDESLVSHRSAVILLAVFAGLALALAAVGLFGVSSYLVARRSRELAIRMALGARVRQIRHLILRQGLSQALIGLVMGLAGAWGIGRLMTKHLYLVNAADPVALVLTAVVLVVVMALAVALPAHRAGRIRPNQVLQEN